MKIVSIKDILLTGNFGDIHLGMTKDRVIDKLGQPIFDEFTTENETGILRYGRYEFLYWKSNDILYGFSNTWLSGFGMTKEQHKKNIYFSNKAFKMDLSFMKVGHISTNLEVKQWLIANNVPFEEKIDAFNNIVLYFQSGVTLHFIDTSDYITFDEFNKPELMESLQSSECFLLEGIRQYDFSITKT